MSQRGRTLILDLGDVLFHWSTRELTALPPQDFHSVILSPTWTELERGSIDEPRALGIIGEELSIEPATISEAFKQCRKTLRVDHDLLGKLKELKAEMNGHLKIYAMSNIARDDFARLQAVLSDWSLFDGVYTSYEAGMTKFELGFFEHVLKSIGCSDPTSAIFVDDKHGQVNTARSFGIQGIVFESGDKLMRQLRSQLFDPVERARQYMADHAGKHMSRIENGPDLHEFFSQFIIHYELADESFLSLSPPNAEPDEVEAAIGQARKEAKMWNYFNGPPIGTTKTCKLLDELIVMECILISQCYVVPDDVDTTANALLAFSPPSSSTDPVLDRMLQNRHAQDGVALTYLCDKRPRLDPVVLTNVIRVFYKYNRGADVKPELDYVRRILLNRGYIDGTDMYQSADSFLYFLSCLIEANDTAPEIRSLGEPTAAALREYVGRRGDSFAVTARVLACQKLGVWAQPDIEYLKELQECDGGWEIGWVCRFGRSHKRIGSRGVPTAWAIKALENEAQALVEQER
ncbi:uncharacterized protein J4E84_004342 [Alternaria hordeiaustralica]|uniref:uncharacterized protein n=1 Tax=Alternaria hordeiaustralica TaxID=1187925 RepID=UPI0020C23E9C|nr:uncharacterized protein J4E84_004342 [Alternaria hordeiaustralica]KAI4690160.1 hypothetical protein J4E84_004342 [Alternaria hordeiaustralica]